MAGAWEGVGEEEYGLQWDVDRVDLDFKTGGDEDLVIVAVLLKMIIRTGLNKTLLLRQLVKMGMVVVLMRMMMFWTGWTLASD